MTETTSTLVFELESTQAIKNLRDFVAQVERMGAVAKQSKNVQKFFDEIASRTEVVAGYTANLTKGTEVYNEQLKKQAKESKTLATAVNGLTKELDELKKKQDEVRASSFTTQTAKVSRRVSEIGIQKTPGAVESTTGAALKELENLKTRRREAAAAEIQNAKLRKDSLTKIDEDIARKRIEIEKRRDATLGQLRQKRMQGYREEIAAQSAKVSRRITEISVQTTPQTTGAATKRTLDDLNKLREIKRGIIKSEITDKQTQKNLLAKLDEDTAKKGIEIERKKTLALEKFRREGVRKDQEAAKEKIRVERELTNQFRAEVAARQALAKKRLGEALGGQTKEDVEKAAQVAINAQKRVYTEERKFAKATIDDETQRKARIREINNKSATDIINIKNKIAQKVQQLEAKETKETQAALAERNIARKAEFNNRLAEVRKKVALNKQLSDSDARVINMINRRVLAGDKLNKEMREVVKQIRIKITHNRQLSESEKRLANTLAQTTTSMGVHDNMLIRLGGSINKIRQMLARVRNAVLVYMFAVRGIIDPMANAIRKAAELEKGMAALDVVGRRLGISQGTVRKAAIDLTKDGLLNVSEASLALSRLLATGIGLPKAQQLLSAFKDSAVFAGQGTRSLNENIIVAIDGFRNFMSRALDNIGITKNASVIIKQYARSVNKTVEEMTELEKHQALANGLIQEAALYSGNAQLAANTLTGQVERLSNAWDLFNARVGQFIASKGAIKEVADTLFSLAETMDRLKKSDVQRALEFGESLENLTDKEKEILKSLELQYEIQRNLKDILGERTKLDELIRVGLLPLKLLMPGPFIARSFDEIVFGLRYKEDIARSIEENKDVLRAKIDDARTILEGAGVKYSEIYERIHEIEKRELEKQRSFYLIHVDRIQKLRRSLFEDPKTRGQADVVGLEQLRLYAEEISRINQVLKNINKERFAPDQETIDRTKQIARASVRAAQKEAALLKEVFDKARKEEADSVKYAVIDNFETFFNYETEKKAVFSALADDIVKAEEAAAIKRRAVVELTAKDEFEKAELIEATNDELKAKIISIESEKDDFIRTLTERAARRFEEFNNKQVKDRQDAADRIENIAKREFELQEFYTEEINNLHKRSLNEKKKEFIRAEFQNRELAEDWLQNTIKDLKKLKEQREAYLNLQKQKELEYLDAKKLTYTEAYLEYLKIEQKYLNESEKINAEYAERIKDITNMLKEHFEKSQKWMAEQSLQVWSSAFNTFASLLDNWEEDSMARMARIASQTASLASDISRLQRESEKMSAFGTAGATIGIIGSALGIIQTLTGRDTKTDMGAGTRGFEIGGTISRGPQTVNINPTLVNQADNGIIVFSEGGMDVLHSTLIEMVAESIDRGELVLN